MRWQQSRHSPVTQALHAHGEGKIDLPTGTVYPALQRLESQGLVRSGRSTDTGRRRRTYTLTAARIAVAKSGPAAVVAAAYIPFIGALWLLAFTPGNGPAALLHTVPALRTGPSP